MVTKMPVSSIAVKLEDDIRERLHSLGAAQERSTHWLMKRAILEFLEKEERFQKELQEDTARWENYVLTGETIEHDEMKDWLQSLGKS